MRIIGVDPGPQTSGVVLVSESSEGRPPRLRMSDPSLSPDAVISAIRSYDVGLVVCEWLTTYGATVGASVLDTARFVGRCEQAARDCGADVALMLRPDVCLELCQSRRAKKSEVRAALLEIYPATGGGKTPQIGTVRARGPLYGMRSHAWDALAVVVAWLRRETA